MSRQETNTKMKIPLLTHERLLEVLHYDKDTGKFKWKVQLSGRGSVGRIAGSLLPNGYINIAIDGERLLTHRLAWFYIHKEWPENYIDHVNCVRTDNRIVKLRLATNSENQMNRGIPKNNTSGVKGVSWVPRISKWRAHIWHRGVGVHLGYFDEIVDAGRAYTKAATRFYEGFSRSQA